MPRSAPLKAPLFIEENRRFKRAADEPAILNDLACAIGALTNPDEKAYDSVKTLIRENTGSSGHEQPHLNQTLPGRMHLDKKSSLTTRYWRSSDGVK